MKKIIENWVHIPGVHCGSVTLRDVATYYGYNWSEPMCFGIGGGLGFYYTRRDDLSPTRMIFVRGPHMEPTFLSLADKPTEWKHGNKETVGIIKNSIERDVPVIIQTDIYYLHYYESSTHFPGHIVSVWGYDDDKEKMFVADNHFEGLMEVDYGEFLEGMGSKDKSNPLDYNYIEVEPGKLRELAELIPMAIRENARKMLKGAAGGRGESGVFLIKSWAEDLLIGIRHGTGMVRQVRISGDKKEGSRRGGVQVDIQGFLREAEEIVPTLKDLNLSREMDEIGEKWSGIAELLKDISIKDEPDKNILNKASERAYEIWEREREFYEKALREVNV